MSGFLLIFALAGGLLYAEHHPTQAACIAAAHRFSMTDPQAPRIVACSPVTPGPPI